MKTLKFSLWVCLLLIGLSSCSNNTPEYVAKSFAEAFCRGDFEKAQTFCTPKTRQAFNLISMMSDKDKDQMMKEIGFQKVKVIVENCEIKENEDGEETAQVYITIKDGNEEKKDKIDLVKYDGEWRVVFKLK